MKEQGLFLGGKGLYQLSVRAPSTKKNILNSLIKALPWSMSNCTILRDNYWELVKSYPTSNLIEIYKIIKSEIAEISPLPGKTSAYIIHISKNSSIVLYCCFSHDVLAKAKHYNLFRLIPETLPLYRQLFNKEGTYNSNVTLEPVLYDSIDTDTDNHHSFLKNSLLLQISDSNIASLSVSESKGVEFFITQQLDNAIEIKEAQYASILKHFHVLKFLDCYSQVLIYLSELKSRWGHIGPYFLVFTLSFIFTVVIGVSAYSVWQNDYLSSKVATQNSYALESIQATNKLKEIKNDIIKINKTLKEHPEKSPILIKLSELSEKQNFEITTIDISPVDIQLQGLTDSAVNLLSTLSKTPGFNDVEFVRSPSPDKEGQERFYIKLSYDVNGILL